MVEDRITDGTRIAQLLSSELDGREDGGLESLAVTNADKDAEPTADGTRAYDVTMTRAVDTAADESSDDTTQLAQVFVQPDRARLEFTAGQDGAAEAAADADLRVRPKATQPPRTLVFVESGAEVKQATDVVQAVLSAVQTTD
ncbi:uncharacterized protein Nmag_0187 [Natrialba magadii ATCC 43099]|uniref:DUF7993 domain-containing protein n=1 Tax=Natrialba magadii (strain ATCC 43099 / DSM 3394 / CCM 3739 / CIP 104546 / IAM 13178 / JCM 8861 / NBRC 102185 / NCIMB 2190 / MS3) TaxID=547559 RepID=D3SWI7_NATMM|nr:hypothetical protein [Natrialba magadii]ADD03779.1 uncharacterized protein Nmag_0187 [Natrialba magadii ATCC 43099]ELY33834.1 hypothetical protein C500_01373 [Natrialba magadii ATCC 43099]